MEKLGAVCKYTSVFKMSLMAPRLHALKMLGRKLIGGIGTGLGQYGMRSDAHSPDGVELVGELAGDGVAVEAATGAVVDDALGGEGVDAHLAGGVDDFAFAQVDAHMDDVAAVVAEKAQVVATGLGKGGHLCALCGLLRGVAQKAYAAGFETDLGEPRTVDAHPCASAPEVGGTEVLLFGHGGRAVGGWQGVLGGGMAGVEGLPLLVVHPPLVAVVVAANVGPKGLTV